MKKNITGLFLTFVLVAVMAFTACGSDNNTAPDDGKREENTKEDAPSGSSGNTSSGNTGSDNTGSEEPTNGSGDKTPGKYEYFNVEYRLSYREVDEDGDGVIDYTDYYDSSDNRSTMMYAMFCAKSSGIHGPAVEYWMDCFAYEGEFFYGNRPYDEPSGLIDNMIAYDNQGNVTCGMISDEAYMNYSFDAPVIYDAMDRTYYHFVRVSDKIFY